MNFYIQVKLQKERKERERDHYLIANIKLNYAQESQPV